MRTRCATCGTVFRISAEQLRARNGLVRCGQCKGIFNAFDTLVEEVVVPPASAVGDPLAATPPTALTSPAVTTDPPPEPEEIRPALPPTPAELSEIPLEDLPVQERLDPVDAALASETPEESAQAAREAGLAALRDISETPGYNRWSAGAVDSGPPGQFVIPESGRRAVWPFVTAIVLLVLLLVAQVLYVYRAECVQRFPDLRPIAESMGLDIPLQKQVDLVTIESSDLQSDAARGQLILQATLKNRAAFAQAWPALELTLTDASDGVVARRVLGAADYLPARTDATAFAANSEIGLRLWIESKQPASGYRLYVFYP